MKVKGKRKEEKEQTVRHGPLPGFFFLFPFPFSFFLERGSPCP
jgi:hypothetical protein